MRFNFGLLLPLLLSILTPLFAQDTLSFGGIYDLPGAEVRASYTPVSPLAQQFTIEEVYRLPGTFYDPARLVALLPGVVQTNDQANHLSVRGNTPNANLWRLNGLAIVNPNHTANAGTFYDFPTLNGGGVNAISAQMLGNSGFLAGGLPVEYGYATGGTFDLRLRPGSKARRKYQAQAGFIGFDLMAEGPIGTSGKTSYLVNGRYSFTGLLADMGVDFGGEEIRFWDFNGHLHHEWDGGELSLFSIVGASSNVFAGPDSTETEIMEQKELFDIDFESDVLISGVSLSQKIFAGMVNAGIAYSATESVRESEFLGDGFIRIPGVRHNVTNANFSYIEQASEFESFNLGLEYIHTETEITGVMSFRDGQRIFDDADITVFSPFFKYRFKNKRHDLGIGIRGSFQSGRELADFVAEPRIRYQLNWNKQRLVLSAQRATRLPIASLLGEAPELEKRFTPVSNQVDLKYGFNIREVNASIGGFFQYTPREYASRDGSFLYSSNNLLELPVSGDGTYIREITATRRYGVEFEIGGGRLSEGLYYRGNLTLLRAETQQPLQNSEWSQDRYSARFIGKITLGREWKGEDKKKRERALGLNLSLISHGGERYGQTSPSLCFNCGASSFVPLDNSDGLINSTGTYFRPDLRLYKTKTRKKTTTTLALDVQNAANVQNLANVYYDAFLERPNERYQLGLIPVLSYRIVWR